MGDWSGEYKIPRPPSPSGILVIARYGDATLGFSQTTEFGLEHFTNTSGLLYNALIASKGVRRPEQTAQLELFPEENANGIPQANCTAPAAE